MDFTLHSSSQNLLPGTISPVETQCGRRPRKSEPAIQITSQKQGLVRAFMHLWQLILLEVKIFAQILATKPSKGSPFEFSCRKDFAAVRPRDGLALFYCTQHALLIAPSANNNLELPTTFQG